MSLVCISTLTKLATVIVVKSLLCAEAVAQGYFLKKTETAVQRCS